MAKAISVTQLMRRKSKLMKFEGKWLNSFGKPEFGGTWLIWGGSGNGKTSLVLQLCKYLTQFGRVAYNSLEEGFSESMKLAFAREGMMEVAGRMVLLDKEPIEELKERLRKRKAPQIVVIDSIQYSDLNYKGYKELNDEFRHVTFIIISHAEGKKPADRRANSIRYDASVKIFIEGYIAFVTSRYNSVGTSEFVIWEKGAEEYHGANTI